jgi:hypothetical protein
LIDSLTGRVRDVLLYIEHFGLLTMPSNTVPYVSIADVRDRAARLPRRNEGPHRADGALGDGEGVGTAVHVGARLVEHVYA